MKLSLKLIARCIAQGTVRIAAERRAEPDAMRLRCLMLYDREGPWEEYGAYVIPGEAVGSDFRCPKGIALIVLGDADPALFSGAEADVMIWSTQRQEMRFREQFNYLSGVFLDYQEMERRLLERLNNGAPLSELVALGEKMLGNPILLLDENYSLLLKPHGANPLDWEPGKITQAPTLSAELVDQIRMSREFRNRDKHNGLFYLSAEALDCGVLFLHIRQDEIHFFAAVLEMERPIREGDPQLLLFFSNFLFSSMRALRYSRADSISFMQFLTKLVSNAKIELPEFHRQLQAQKWNLQDHYVCVAAELDLWNQKDMQSFSLCWMFESRFRGSRAFSHEDRIVCIVNLDQAGLERPVFLQLLSQFVRDQVLRVGVSYGFRDFVALPNYYHQALAALELGRELSPDEWNYRFEKYVLPYFIRYGTSKMEGKYLCHPDLVTLCRYDRENHTELLQTLKVYLACGQNATTSAAELYIHRNTLYQRLNKIESLLGDNLNSPEARLYMQISFHIVDFSSL